jgi:hypothetical protein
MDRDANSKTECDPAVRAVLKTKQNTIVDNDHFSDSLTYGRLRLRLRLVIIPSYRNLRNDEAIRQYRKISGKKTQKRTMAKGRARKKSSGNITAWLVDKPNEKASKDSKTSDASDGSDGSDGAVRGDRKRAKPADVTMIPWTLAEKLINEAKADAEKRVAEANEREKAANEREKAAKADAEKRLAEANEREKAANEREKAAKADAEKRLAEANEREKAANERTERASERGMRMTMAVVKAANKDFMNFSKFAFDRICDVAQDALGNAQHLKDEAIPSLQLVESKLTTGVQGRLLLGPSSATFDFVTGTKGHVTAEVRVPAELYTRRNVKDSEELTGFKATMEPRMVSKRCIDEAKSYVEREDFPKVKRRRLRRSSIK